MLWTSGYTVILTHISLETDQTRLRMRIFFFLRSLPINDLFSLCSCPGEDLQMVCGFSCDDLLSMFKELKGLGVVVKELSNELRQLVRRKATRPSGGRVQETVWLSDHISLEASAG